MGLRNTVISVSYGPKEAVGHLIKSKRGMKEEGSNGNRRVNPGQIGAEVLGQFCPPEPEGLVQPLECVLSPGPVGTPGGCPSAAPAASHSILLGCCRQLWRSLQSLESLACPVSSELCLFLLLWAISLFLSILNRPHRVGMQWKEFDLSQAKRLGQSQPSPKLSV